MSILRGPALRGSLLCAGLTLIAGCGGKELVSLSADIEDGELRLERAALGTSLSGSFRLVLRLGSEAPSDTEVSLAGVALSRDKAELRSALDAEPARNFPFGLSPGASLNTDFSIEEPELLPAAEADLICSGALQIVVVVTDSLSEGKTTTTSSAPFSPTCGQ